MSSRRNRLAVLALLGAISLTPLPAVSASISWVAATGQWNTDTNWDLLRDPIAGDDVDLINFGSIDKNIFYVSDDDNDVMNTVTIDAYSTGGMTLVQNNTQKLQTNIEYVGKDGTGTYLLQGGQNLLQGASELYVGFNATADGSYYINSGVSLLDANNVYIGYSGTGAFIHSAGTADIGALMLGENAGGDGSYELSGTGLLTVGSQEYVGYSGAGSFTQSGGTNTAASNLTLGFNSTGNGNYSLSGGSLLTSHQVVGLGGTGSFTQSGGSNDTSGNLYLGVNSGSNGSYTITGGTYDIAGDIVDGAGQGTLNIDGGTLTVGGLDITVDDFVVGWAPGSNGSHDLDPSNTLTVGDTAIIGAFGTGTFNQSGGQHNVGTSLTVGGAAAAQGTYDLSGAGWLSTPALTIGLAGTGAFSQSGGSNLVTASLVLGDASGSFGSYELSGSGLLQAPVQTIGLAGTGVFNQSGGGNNILGDLELATNAGSSGTYTLSGGSLTVVGAIVGGAGTSSLSIDGGVIQAGGTSMTVTQLVVGDATGSSGSVDSLDLSASDVSAESITIGASGTGAFSHSYGWVTASGFEGLTLGEDSGASGSYALGGSGALFADYETIGLHGTGVLTQTNSYSLNAITNVLYVGGEPLSATGVGDGTYNLVNGLLDAPDEWIGYNTTGAFNQSGGTNSVTNLLGLGFAAGANGTYDLSGTGTLSAVDTHVGENGTGTFTQSGGTHTITLGRLELGSNVGSAGSYALSGGSLVAPSTRVGGFGSGSFTQTGGTHTPTELYIGDEAGSTGSYDLSGPGSLSTPDTYVGGSGAGSFTQSSGTHIVTTALILGANSTGDGSYDLSGVGSLTAQDEWVGLAGTGSFAQSGGTHAVVDTLTIGRSFAGPSGSYALSGGNLDANVVDLELTGSFTQTGGMLDFTTFNQNGGTVNGTLQNQGTFNYNSGSFAGRLLNQGVANLGASFTAADGMENQSSHTVGAADTLTLNGSGLLNLGTFSVDGLIDGTGPLSNSGFLIGSGEIGGSGGFTNTGLLAGSSGFEISNSGANANYGNLIVSNQLRLTGGSFSNGGTLDLGSGTVFGGATLTNTFGGTIVGRGTILNAFSNPGGVVLLESGTTNISQAFFNDGLIQLTGFSANLTGGTISNAGTIQGLGHVGNDVVNALGGTIEAIGGTLTLSGSVSNDVYGLVTAAFGSKVLAIGGLGDNEGLINLSGGTFDNNGWNLTNSGQISGHGTLRSSELINDGSITLTGGATTVNGNVTNNLGRQIEVAHDTALFTDDVTNFGTFKTTNAIVTFAGTYTENGGYISDPSDNFFEDIILGETGYLVGGVGDRFFVDGDFLSASVLSGVWQTRAAELIFQGGTGHTLQYTGADLGAVGDGYADNFAWGVLQLGAGDTLILGDGDAVPGAALYVDVLRLEGGVGQIASILGNGFDIYYKPWLSENAYLGGETYALSNGGFLMAVPEPSTAVLLGLGLAGLTLRRRQQQIRARC